MISPTGESEACQPLAYSTAGRGFVIALFSTEFGDSGGRNSAPELARARRNPGGSFHVISTMIAKASVSIGSSVAGFALSALMGLIAPAAAETFEDRWSIIPKAKAEPAPQPAQAAPAPAGQAGDTGSPASRTQKKSFSGRASFYSYARGKTASGAAYNRNAMTAAHRSLPFGTKLWVTDLATNKAVTVVVTDRGPWIRGRVLDLSLEAARNLGITERGLANVRAEIL